VGLVQKLLEILLSMRGLLTHLFDFRCLIGPLYGWSSSLHHQYGGEWALSCG
jgi:hypothetical protein